MNFFKVVAAVILVLTTTNVTAPVNAQDSPVNKPTPGNQVLDACVRNQAETLPIPFSDVAPDHWAFKAVMTMYYCGAFRQATPTSLLEEPPSTKSDPVPKEPKLQSQ